jgi:hypothetical protein
MPALDTGDITNDIIPDDWTAHPLYAKGELAAWTQPHEDDTIVGVAPYYASLVSMPQIAITDDPSGNQIVTVFHSGLAVGFANQELGQNYRHIFVSRTELDEQGIWTTPEDLTGDIIHIFSECVYPALFADANTSTFHLLYQTDNLPGNSIQPTGGNHAPDNNNMVHLTYGFPVGIANNADIAFEVSQNAPNPASEQTSIAVKVDKATAITLVIHNMLGQQIYSESVKAVTPGTHTFKVDVSGFAPGICFYTVTAGDKSVCRKMTIK